MRFIFGVIAAILCLLASESVFAAQQMTPRQAFYYHAHRGDLSSIQKLKQLGYVIDQADDKGNSSLCEAVWRQDQTAVNVLVKAGANTNAGCMQKIPTDYKMRVNLVQRYVSSISAAGTTTGMSSATMVGVGVGAVALIGGGVALASGGGSSSSGGTKKTCTGELSPDPKCKEVSSCVLNSETLYTCLECLQGYDLKNNACKPSVCTGVKGAISNCKTLSNPCYSGEDIYYTCNVCDNNYKLGGNTSCIPDTTCSGSTRQASDSNCTNETTCTPSGGTITYYTCHSCGEGYTLNNNQCVPNSCSGFTDGSTSEIEHCQTETTCQSGAITYHKCSGCESDYILHNNKCVYKCSEGTTATISHCKASHSCSTVGGVTLNTCTECNLGYDLVSSTQCSLHVCDSTQYPSTSSSITHCATTVDQCQSGSDLFYGCSSCSKGYKGRKCDACDTENGYALSGGSCVQTCSGVSSKNIEHCKNNDAYSVCVLDGTNLYKCTECVDGFVPSADGKTCIPDSACQGVSEEIQHCEVTPTSCLFGTTTLYACPSCQEGWVGAACNTCDVGYEGGECSPTCTGLEADTILHCENYDTCTLGTKTLKKCSVCTEPYIPSADGTACVWVDKNTETQLFGRTSQHNNNEEISLSNVDGVSNYGDRTIAGLYYTGGVVYGAYTNSVSGNTNSQIEIINTYPEGTRPVYGIYGGSGTSSHYTYGANSQTDKKATNAITINNTSNGEVYGLYSKSTTVYSSATTSTGASENTVSITNIGNGNVYGSWGKAVCNTHAGGSGVTRNSLSITNTGNGYVYGLYGDTGAAQGAHAYANGSQAINIINITNTGTGTVIGLNGKNNTIGAYTETNINSIASNQLTIKNTGIGSVYALASRSTDNTKVLAGAYDAVGGSATNEIILENDGNGSVFGIVGSVNAVGASSKSTVSNTNSKVENTMTLSNKKPGDILGINSTSGSAMGAYTTGKVNATNILSVTEALGTVYGISSSSDVWGAYSTGTANAANMVFVTNNGTSYGMYSSKAKAYGAQSTSTGNTVNEISLTNTAQNLYGLYGTTYVNGAYNSSTGSATNTINLNNTGSGAVYGLYWKGIGTTYSYGSYASKGTATNKIKIENKNGNTIYGFQGASNFYGAYAAAAGMSVNYLDILNKEKESVLDSGNVYGVYTTGATTNLSYATGTNSVSGNTIKIINNDDEQVYGVFSGGTVYGANAASGGTANNNLIIKGGTNSGNIYGFYGSSTGSITGAVKDNNNATESNNTLSIVNFGSGDAYGMYGKRIISSTNYEGATNTINMVLIGRVTEGVASGRAIGIYGSGDSITNRVTDTITINSLGGNYKIGEETITSTTDNTTAIGIYVAKDTSLNNAGTITIKRAGWTDNKDTPLDTTDDIIYTPNGSGGSAYGIYVLGGNSTGETITNSGTIDISGIGKGYGIYVKDGTNVTVVNSGTIKISDSDNSLYNGMYNGSDENGRFIVLNGGNLVQAGLMSVASTVSNMSWNLASGSQTNITGKATGMPTIMANTVTYGFDQVYTEKDMLNVGDASELKLKSGSALFDASLNGSDVVMTMKGFDTATTNKSLADFLSKNYSLKNNEEFYNKLKSFGDVNSLTDSLNKLTGKDMLSRFNFEDMTMMRELNFDMNEKLFHSKEQHFASAGSVSPMAFKGDSGSNARYSLYNKRNGNTSIGLGVAFTKIRSDDDYDNNNRTETSYQLILPMGYKTHGFNLMTSPRIGYARGTYDRTGFDEKTYDGTIEKRVFGLMNEARYPITVGNWKLEPSAEFNILGYQQKGHEDAKEFALNIQNQNTYSVEGGIGLYVTREEELDKDSTLKLTAGMVAYHEFADPYRVKVGMNGMDGAFTLRDENRSDNRSVIRAGFDYVYRDLSLYGSLISYVDKEVRTSAKTGINWKF